MEKLQVVGQKGVIKKKSKAGCVRYAECERNHAVKDGGSVVDGCKEFIASDENEGTDLTCSCCGCHRNYHRIVEDTDQESFGVGEQKKRKRRELKSKVWDDFTRSISIDKDGKEWAICKHCKGQFDGSSKNGTTHLKKHLESMKCRAKRNGGDGNEDVSTQIRYLATLTPVVMKEKSSVIDEDVSTQIRDLATLTPVVMKEKPSVIDEEVSTQIRDLATLTPVVMKEKPSVIDEDVSTQIRDLATLTPVVIKEKPSVIDLIKQRFYNGIYLTVDRDPSVLNSRKDEILRVYQEEKEKQGEFLNNLSCRFSLHIVRSYPVRLLMVHFIDDSWERQIKIVSIIPWENYIEDTKKTCLNLKNDRNICSIRHDGLMAEDDKDIIESWFNQRGSLPFAGVGLEFYGFGVEIRLFKEMWKMNEIDGLRECVDYGYKTSSNKLKLQHAVNNAKTMGKNVIFDDDPCFDGLFEYLELAVGLKEAFSEMEKIDSDFISINLTNRKWDEATATFEHFKALEEFVGSFNWDNCSSITTGVVDILKLFRFHSSEDCQVCKNASYKKLFDKIQVYLVVVILDPRFKMDTIQCWYKEFYGSDGYFEKTLKDFRDVYDEYAKDSGEDYKMMDAMGRPCTSSTKSELDLYLHHLKVPAVEGFDILAWWRGNAPFYPTLSRMARDYLAIPIIINEILFDLYFFYEIYDIKYCIEIDDDIKSALMYLSGLVYYQAKVEKNE